MEPDRSRQIPTLTAPQEAALCALLGGANVAEAARAAGVSRQTVSGWLNGDPVFIAEYRTRRADLWSGVMNRLEVRLAKAADTVAALLDHDDWRARLAASKVLLDMAERHFPSHPSETTPDAVVKEKKQAARMEKLFEDIAI